MKRAYRFRFYPTPEQETEFIRTWGCVRLVYNRALEYRNAAWFSDKKRVSYADTDKLLTTWKRDPELAFLSEVSSVPLQQCLRHLQTAYVNFFAKRARYPKFKSRKKSRLSLTYSVNGFRFRDGQLFVAKLSEPLEVVFSRDFPQNTASTLTVSRDSAGRWFASLLCETTVADLPKTGNTTGIDLGVKDLAVFADGTKHGFDKERMHYKQQQVVKAQRELSRKQDGSRNREKAKLKLARKIVKVTDYRRDVLHKLTTAVVVKFDTVVIEDLNVSGMSRKGKHKRGLNRSILSSNLGEFRTLLEYKAGWYGKDVVVIDRWFPSSKTCSSCGKLNTTLALSDRTWTCSGCGTTHDRDCNAAKNIEAAGLAVLACGDGVRHARV